MEGILLLGVALPIIAQVVIVSEIQESTNRAFGHRICDDGCPTLFGLFLMLVPGSFIILLIINYVVVPMISAVKFVINFVQNKLKKKKLKEKMLFDTIETKYAKLIGKLYQ